MTKNNFRKALRSRKPVIGSWLQTGSPAAAETLAQAGFDWLGIDCENTSTDLAGVEALCRATYGRGPAMLVRVRANDTLAIRQALDVGAQGVIVPLVHDAEQARQAAAAAKYPPRGVRGHTFGRMNNWGADFVEYARTANERVVVIAMIELQAGVENIDAILSVPDVDGVFTFLCLDADSIFLRRDAVATLAQARKGLWR